jgi:hypothetical protein
MSPTVQFQPTKHIVDIADLIEEASHLDMTRLRNVAKVIEREGLLASAPQDSDEQAFGKIYSHFNRDALKHRWEQEGSIGGFDTALTNLIELLGKGTIDGVPITKPLHLFTDKDLINGLTATKDALGALKGLSNQLVNSGKIDRGNQFAVLDRDTVQQINRAKMRVLDQISEIGQRYSLAPILMYPPRF